MAQGVPGRLRPRIFLTFGTTRVVRRQPCEPAAFTPGEIHGTHFQRLSRTQGGATEKIPSDTILQNTDPWLQGITVGLTAHSTRGRKYTVNNDAL